jgi:broad specificity phosphatase PhoE
LKLHIVRHGETLWNTEGRMQGHLDSPLTPKGKAQALLVKKCLAFETIDFVYSSSCKRAMETAKIISGEKKIHPVDELREIKLGVMEGRSTDYVNMHYKNEYDTFWNKPSEFKVKGSETFKELQKRVVSAVKKIIRNHSGKSILLISHAAVIKTILVYFEGISLDKIWNPPYITNGAHIIAESSDGNTFSVKICGNENK